MATLRSRPGAAHCLFGGAVPVVRAVGRGGGAHHGFPRAGRAAGTTAAWASSTRGVAATSVVTRRDWAALLTIGFGVSLVIMDATIVNVALPVVIEDLSLTASEAQWMNAVYSLVFAALLITVGRIGDLEGRRLLFLIGMVVFMLASVVAGLSVNGPMLIAARLVQGIGAAMILPSTLSSLNALFVGRAAGHRLRGVRLGDRRDGRARPAARWLAGDRLLVAVGVLAQHPRGPARGRRHRPGAARDARPEGHTESRPAGCGPCSGWGRSSSA